VDRVARDSGCGVESRVTRSFDSTQDDKGKVAAPIKCIFGLVVGGRLAGRRLAGKFLLGADFFSALLGPRLVALLRRLRLFVYVMLLGIGRRAGKGERENYQEQDGRDFSHHVFVSPIRKVRERMRHPASISDCKHKDRKHQDCMSGVRRFTRIFS